jgi:hypothetical protein
MALQQEPRKAFAGEGETTLTPLSPRVDPFAVLRDWAAQAGRAPAPADYVDLSARHLELPPLRAVLDSYPTWAAFLSALGIAAEEDSPWRTRLFRALLRHADPPSEHSYTASTSLAASLLSLQAVTELIKLISVKLDAGANLEDAYRAAVSESPESVRLVFGPATHQIGAGVEVHEALARTAELVPYRVWAIFVRQAEVYAFSGGGVAAGVRQTVGHIELMEERQRQGRLDYARR